MQNTHTFSALPRTKELISYKDRKETRKMRRCLGNSNLKESLRETKQEIKTYLINQLHLPQKDDSLYPATHSNIPDNIEISTERMGSSHGTQQVSLHSASTIPDRKGKNIRTTKISNIIYSHSNHPDPRPYDPKSTRLETFKKQSLNINERHPEDYGLYGSGRKVRTNSENCYNRIMTNSDLLGLGGGP